MGEGFQTLSQVKVKIKITVHTRVTTYLVWIVGIINVKNRAEITCCIDVVGTDTKSPSRISEIKQLGEQAKGMVFKNIIETVD